MNARTAVMHWLESDSREVGMKNSGSNFVVMTRSMICWIGGLIVEGLSRSISCLHKMLQRAGTSGEMLQKSYATRFAG